ncbi:phage holin family protein [Lentzea tibetensis]|uniref:Phage holin family protein n=1 Tax=Lentzea tibetensis TaxID=2591470 RepID=A0A563EUV6_9PSEU|nr:phage holin family protein [Lentzea tibetensis]TWP51433.1 phage holin family protein [Lentzea tibetensis]
MTIREQHVPSIPLTADDPTAEQSIGGLVRDATAHVSTLVRAEVELAKGEIKAEVKKGLQGSVYFIAALAIVCFSLFFLFMSLAFIPYSFGWPLWTGFAIVTFLMLVSAGLLGFLGYRRFRKIRAPQRTIESAKDTMAALRHRGDDN